MRRYLLALLAMSAFITACPDDVEDPPPAGDAAVTQQDATVRPDATTADGGVDEDATVNPDATANEDAAVNEDATVEEDGGTQPPGEVIVRSGMMGLPLQVFFQDPNGDLISAKTTTTGEAREIVPPDSMVTIYPLIFTGKGPEATQFRTIVGVQPGEIYEVPSITAVTVIGDLSVTLPGVLPNAVYYTYQFGCGEYSVFDPTMPDIVGIEERCAAVTAAGLLVVAVAYDENGLPIGYSADETVQLVPQGQASVTLGAWQTTFETVDTELANPPADTVALFWTRSLISGAGRFFDQGAELMDPTMGQTFSFSYPPIGAGSAVQAFAATSDGAINGLITFPAGRPTVRIDFTADLLPRASAQTIDRSDIARPTISWTASTGTVDATIVTFAYSNPNTDLNWSITVPPNRSSMRLPELPDDFAQFRPTQSSDMVSGILDLDSSLIPDYTAYRRGIGSVLIQDFNQTFNTGALDSTLRITANPPDVGPF